MSDERDDSLPEDVLAFVRAEKDRPALSQGEIASIRGAVEEQIFNAHGKQEVPAHSMSFPPAMRERAKRWRRATVFSIGAFAGAAALGLVVAARELGQRGVEQVDHQAVMDVSHSGAELAQARAAVAIENLIATDHKDEARAALAEFERAYPNSDLLPALRQKLAQ